VNEWRGEHLKYRCPWSDEMHDWDSERGQQPCSSCVPVFTKDDLNRHFAAFREGGLVPTFAVRDLDNSVTYFCECGTCGALVEMPSALRHAQWHSEGHPNGGRVHL
jgi:hypothetical protein